MDDLMQTLYLHILQQSLPAYYKQTGYYEENEKRDAIEAVLLAQLTPQQSKLLEQLNQAHYDTQACELEAMFLAAFDQCMLLFRPHMQAL